jgi:hypothetical protein
VKISVAGTQKLVLGNEVILNSTDFLFQGLRDLGYEVSSLLDGDFLISINHSPSDYRKFIVNGGKSSRTILIRTEPESVFPVQYKEKIFTKYGLVFTPGGIPEIQLSKTFVNHPYLYNINPVKPRHDDPSIETIVSSTNFSDRFDLVSWSKRELLLSLVASNKVSPTSSNNYSLRRSYALKYSGNGLHVYGNLWKGSFYSKTRLRLGVLAFSLRNFFLPNPKSIYGKLLKKYPNTHGEVENKHTIIEMSRFSLVIENNNDCITEKIFDALMGGSIPLYIGPDLSKFDLPDKIALTVKDPSANPIELIKSLDNSEIREILSNIHAFVSSETFIRNWTAAGVYRQVLKELETFFRQH